jgi:hypothetical protein
MPSHAEQIDRPVLLVLFIPSTTRNHEPVDQSFWTAEALAVLGTLFGGGTAFPPGRGVWRRDKGDGPLMYTDTTVVHCYTRRSIFDRHIGSLRNFLLRMGRECRQMAVGYVIESLYQELDIDLHGPEISLAS